MELKVQDMSCGHCVNSVTKAVQGIDPEAKVDVDLDAGRVSIASAADPATVRSAIEEAGYPAEVLKAA